MKALNGSIMRGPANMPAPDKAEVLLKSAVAIREKRSGEYSKDLVKSLNDYADFLRKNGRETEARHLDARIKLIQTHQTEE